MKTLSNKKGAALIILIIAMTLISLLGASMVSMMGAKQRSYIYQINSYKSLNIANAGMEYAIRYAYDQTQVADSDFFKTSTFSIGPLNFGGGTFAVTYNYNQAIASDNIVVDATHQGVTRKVRLYRFRYYALKGLSRVPGDVPRILPSPLNDTVEVPLINNNETAIYNFVINMTVNFYEVPTAERKLTITCYGDTAATQTIISGVEYTFMFNPPTPIYANAKGSCLLDFQTGVEKRKRGEYLLKVTDNDVIKFIIP